MTISVLDTTELRWFVAREVPPDVWSWFTVEGRTGLLEERVDSYRMDGRSNRGVKRRFQETLELKVRRSVGERLTLDRNLHGRLETWRRWSPADGLVERDRHTPWVDVDKRVVKRRFSVVGREISLTEDTACHIRGRVRRRGHRGRGRRRRGMELRLRGVRSDGEPSTGARRFVGLTGCRTTDPPGVRPVRRIERVPAMARRPRDQSDWTPPVTAVRCSEPTDER